MAWKYLTSWKLGSERDKSFTATAHISQYITLRLNDTASDTELDKEYESLENDLLKENESENGDFPK